MRKFRDSSENFMQGVFALMFSQIIIKILGLIYSLYLTNKEGFGDSGNAIYYSGFQIYALLLTLSSIGIPNAISKLVSEKLAVKDYNSANRIFKVAFVLFAIIGGIGSFILFFGAGFISKVVLQIPEAEYTLVALSPSIFFVAISAVIRGYFAGRQNMDPTAKSQIIEQVFKATLTILFVEIIAILSNVNTKLMAAGANLATSLATIVSFIYIYTLFIKDRIKENKRIKKEKKFEKERIKKIIYNIFCVSIPISLSSLLSAINKNIDSITVVRILKPILGEEIAKAKYGILSAKVDVLTNLPLAFNIAFATSLVPAIAAAKVKNDNRTINERIRFSILTTIIIGLPCTIGMCMYSQEILSLLYPKASTGSMLLKISSFTIIFTVLAQTINGVLQGLGKVKVPAIALACGVFVKFLTNIILIPMESVYEYGAAIGSVLCHLVSYAIVYNVLKRTINLDFKMRNLIVKPIFATLCMAVVSYLVFLALSIFNLGKLATIIAILIAVIVYFHMVIILHIFSTEDLKTLPNGEKIVKFFKKYNY